MATTFEFISAHESVVAIKLGNSLYFIDHTESLSPVMYDHNLEKTHIISIEWHIPKVTEGKVTYNTIINMAEAYKKGLEEGKSHKYNNCLEIFIRKLYEIIVDQEELKKLKKIFWVEFSNIEQARSVVNKLVSKEDLDEEEQEQVCSIVERYISRIGEGQESNTLRNKIEGLRCNKDRSVLEDLYFLFGDKISDRFKLIKKMQQVKEISEKEKDEHRRASS